MRQAAIGKLIGGKGFIQEIEEGLARERRQMGTLTESIIRSPRNYLAEGGILRVLLLESLTVKKQLGLFYVLSYIYGVYSIKYPEGTSRMEDDDYVLYSKVEAELRQVVPEMMQMLKDTYEAWIVNEIVWYAGWAFVTKRWLRNQRETATSLFFYRRLKPSFKFLQQEPVKTDSLVWSKHACKRDVGVQWSNAEFGLLRRGTTEVIIGEIGLIRMLAIGELSEERELRALGQGDLTAFRQWVNVPDHVYVLPNNLTPSLSGRYFKPTADTPELRTAMGQYEALYGPVTVDTILRFEPHIEQLARGGASVETTKKILKFYHSYLRHPSTDWKRNIATISILLNVAHNTGSMAYDLGSKYTTTREHGVDADYLYKLSNLHKYIPQGTDHKTLEGIYNDCFYILGELK